MTDIATRAVQFANPTTGEVLTLASADEDLLSYLADLREFKSVLEEHRRMVCRELAARRDKIGKWSWVAGDYQASVPSPDPGEEWDGAELHSALMEYVDQDILSIEAVNAAVEIQHVYKVRKAGVQALRKIVGVRDTIDRLARPVERGERNVSVKRRGA